MAKRGRKQIADIISLPFKKKKALEESHSFKFLQNMATKLRMHSVESTSCANSGHPTSCSSLAEIFAVLFFDPSGMKYYPQNPQHFGNDKLVLSKGHAAPILYAAWAEAGLFPVADLKNLRKIDSDLEGHPTPRLPFVDVVTGSLGQGISAACGIAYSIKYFEEGANRVFAILGDGECAEGSVWEAFNFATHYQLDNLVIIIDVNRLGQSDPTMFQHDLNNYKERIESFGWHAINIDGHSALHIIYALEEAYTVKGKPTAIIAKTYKGRDLTSTIEDQINWHGKPLAQHTEEVLKQLEAMIEPTEEISVPSTPSHSDGPPHPRNLELPPPSFAQGSNVGVRPAFGDGLAALGRLDERIVSLDGDTKNSTMAQTFQKEAPGRFIECFIAEQNMVGVALGLSTRGRIPIVSAFCAFLSRAYDHIRITGLSWGNVKFVGTHCGISIGEDGGSQMGLEDLSMFRAIPNSLVLYPSDAVTAYRAVEIAAKHKGVAYIRVSRPVLPVLYDNSESFEGSKVLKSSEQDVVTVIGAGVTTHEALKAWETLKDQGVLVRVVDLVYVKPVDVECLRDGPKLIVTVEDHYPQGGIFEAVAAALPECTVHGLYVNEVPRSGKPEELLEMFGISASHIVSKVKEVIG